MPQNVINRKKHKAQNTMFNIITLKKYIEVIKKYDHFSLSVYFFM